MQKALLIAEKPSLMRTIQDCYNRHKTQIPFQIDFVCQVGHLFTLKLPKEVDSEKYGVWDLKDYPVLFPFKYKIIEGKHKLVQDIKEALANGYDFVIHAGDPDSEGQLLVDESLLILKNKAPVQRFWSNDLTDEAILNELLHMKPNSEYKGFRDAAYVRQHEDYQFGMNTTAIATLKMHELSALGRVKAVIIALLVQRELEIENYVEKRTYKPSFIYNDCEFVLNKAFDTKEEVLNNPIRSNAARITAVSDEVKTIKPPKLFKLSTLQQKMSKIAKWSGSRTLAVLQTLYEAKAVTYPRSDCEYLASGVDVEGIKNSILKENLFEMNLSLLTKTGEQVRADKSYCNDKAISTEGHTAIIPTGQGIDLSMSDEAKLLYSVICRQFLSVFADNKKVRKLKVEAIADNYEQPYIYTESSDIEAGFEFILDPNYEVKRSCGVAFTKDTRISPIEFKVKECVSTPPTHYNDGTLIAAMEKDNMEIDGEKVVFSIGTSATRSNIIDGCEKNGYFYKKGTNFIATDKAKTIYKLFGNVPLFDIQESGRWEYMFNQIRFEGKNPKEVEDFLNEKMIQSAQEMLKIDALAGKPSSNNETLGKCPKCGNDIAYGKFGAYCTNKCGFTFGKAYGKELTKTQIKTLLNGKKILMKGLTSKSGKTYDAYLTPDGISEYEFNGNKKYGFAYKMEFPSKD